MQLGLYNHVSLKQVKPYHLALFSKYLIIRYKTFVKEMGRRFIVGEFNRLDFKARHYVLQINDNIIGTARLVHKNQKTIQISRVAVMKRYRNNGYGAIIVNKLLEVIKKNNFADVVSLLSEDDKINFYLKFGFTVDERIFIDSIPLSSMTINIKKH